MNSNMDRQKSLKPSKGSTEEIKGLEYTQHSNEKLDELLLSKNAEIEKLNTELKKIEQINLLINLDFQEKILHYM
jgi:hypothetical protein